MHQPAVLAVREAAVQAAPLPSVERDAKDHPGEGHDVRTP